MTSYDFAIIGGGIIGLTLAREIAARRPGASVVVLEKEPQVGMHASGRNSGVLHAGFYYAPDSLKAQLTKRGNSLLRVRSGRGVPVKACGKVVVTTDEAQLPALAGSRPPGREQRRATRTDRRVATGRTRTVGANGRSGDLVSHHGSRGPQAMISAMRDAVSRAGVVVRTGARVTGGSPNRLIINGKTMSVGHIVNCAGLYADKVGKWFGFCDDYVMMPFKGLVLVRHLAPGTLKRHVYPVPDPRNPFLGVHFTVTAHGQAKIGPTAIPVLWRENYSWLDRFDTDEFKGRSWRTTRDSCEASTTTVQG